MLTEMEKQRGLENFKEWRKLDKKLDAIHKRISKLSLIK